MSDPLDIALLVIIFTPLMGVVFPAWIGTLSQGKTSPPLSFKKISWDIVIAALFSLLIFAFLTQSSNPYLMVGFPLVSYILILAHLLEKNGARWLAILLTTLLSTCFLFTTGAAIFLFYAYGSAY